MGALFVLGLYVNGQNDTISTATAEDDEWKSSELEKYYEQRNDSVWWNFLRQGQSPRVATLASALVPGLGQIYNGKYYKVPVIYGAGFIMYYWYDEYHFQYKRFKKAYYELKAGDEISDPELADWDKASLEENKNKAQRAANYQIIYMGLLYVANIVDALVDTYMYEFDVSDDLTMKIEPSIMSIQMPDYPATASCGVQLNFRF